MINYEKYQEYIHTWDEFRFYEGALDAFRIFNSVFKYIIVITNQKGVGKGLTRIEDLTLIHDNMKKAIRETGGRIDAIYYCPDLDENSSNRKPNPGMGLQAIKDFRDIDLGKSIMLGNTLGDMQFGRNLGLNLNIFLPTTRPEVDTTDPRIDKVYGDIAEFADSLIKK